MDDFAESMRAATAEAPPHRIDINRLIADEELRIRRLRWATSAGAVAATAAVVFAVAVMPGWGSGAAGRDNSAGLVVPGAELCAPLTPSPTGPQPPEQSYGTVRARPTEPVADAVSRLSAVFDRVLEDQLPGVQVVPALPGCDRPQFQFHPQYKEYNAGGMLTDGKGSGWFYLRLAPTGVDEPLACQPGADDPRCERRALPGGAAATLMSFQMEGGTQYQVTVDRSDGTTVSLMTNNLDYGGGPAATPKVSRPAPILTQDQLIAIGTAPGLTLYP
jgi:hypothetical protein